MAHAEPLTIMVVHAHPDDEAMPTGGTLAGCAAEGIRTVLVTCTNGELGDAPGGVKPGEPGHDERTVVGLRLAELERSCEILGVSHLELLGYHDSGMMGWTSNDRPDCFWQTPVEEGAAKLRVLIQRFRPQVVVTYDANGFYGHPDHIQAHRITMAAVAEEPSVAKVYFPTIPRSKLPEFAAAMAEAGVEIPEPDPEGSPEEVSPLSDEEFGSPDEDIAAVVDCAEYVETKLDALRAHASQAETVVFLRLPTEIFGRFFAQEHYVRELDRVGSPRPETDLFAGLR